MYEVKKVGSAWYEDAAGVCHTVYEQTLASARTWRELLRKETPAWYAGQGCDIFKNGERIGNTDDLANAWTFHRAASPRRVCLRDFLAAATGENY